MREIVFRVLAERPAHLEAQAESLPIRITAATLEELQHEAREALIEHLGPAQLHLPGEGAPRPPCCRQQHPAGGSPFCCSLPLIPAAASTMGAICRG